MLMLMLMLMLLLTQLLTLPQPASAAGPTWSQQMAAGADRVCFSPPSHGGDVGVCVTRLKDGTARHDTVIFDTVNYSTCDV